MEADVFADADDITRLPEVPAILSYSGVLTWMTEDSVPNLIQHRQLLCIQLDTAFNVILG